MLRKGKDEQGINLANQVCRWKDEMISVEIDINITGNGCTVAGGAGARGDVRARGGGGGGGQRGATWRRVIGFGRWHGRVRREWTHPAAERTKIRVSGAGNWTGCTYL